MPIGGAKLLWPVLGRANETNELTGAREGTIIIVEHIPTSRASRGKGGKGKVDTEPNVHVYPG